MSDTIRPWRKHVAHLVALALAAGQVTGTAQAATDISDVPMAVKNLVEPNIMFMLDNSGSMSNVVIDSPYDPAVTYSASPTVGGAACPAGTTMVPAGTSLDIRIVSNQPRIRYSGNDYVFGTGAGERCFDPAATYTAKLHADLGTSSSPYLGASYSGNYLNWYFNMNNTTPTWTSGQQKKPGTQSRLEITRTAAKGILDQITAARVGLSTYENSNFSFTDSSWEGARVMVGMGSISSNLATMKAQIDTLTAAGVTPLSETLAGLGRYFVQGHESQTLTLHPGGANESTATASAVLTNQPTYAAGVSAPTTANPVIQNWCQRNFVVAMTDGRPQADQALTGNTYLSDYDGDCASASPACLTYDRKSTRTYESAGSDYLDDVAQMLYEVDLRPDLNDNAAAAVKNNIVTYMVGFADSTVQSDPMLFEAAQQGGGLFLSATDSKGLVNAFRSILDDILSKDGAAAAVAVANANVTSGENASYASSYNSGTWTGDLQSYAIDINTGTVSSTPTWTYSAQAQLDALATANGNNASSVRKIATHNGVAGGSGAGIAFQWASLAASRQAALHTPVSPPGTADGASVLAFLRGDRTGETVTGPYRGRVHLLGDIVNAEPVAMRPPFYNYADPGYTTFKASNTSRRRIVFQPADDALVHAFAADDGASPPVGAGGGAELWAYLPGVLIDTMDSVYPTTSVLNNLSRKNGFQHRYYADGTPTLGDVDLKNTDSATGSGTDWQTILVGGLGKGGRGYYALKVTTPVPANEAALASMVMWEFPKSVQNATDRATVTANMGYSYGKPVIVKTQNYGWVVLVTSGYNNGTTTGGDGHGYLFVIDARDGNLIEAIQTPDTCTAADPCGLAQIAAYVESTDIDNTTDFVYGGDLKGNVWRFDLTGPKSGWGATKIATLVDGSGNYQPITTVPELAKVPTGAAGFKRFVYVGTGLYLGDSDVPGVVGANAHSSQVQSMYGLVDNLTGSPTITGLRGANGASCPAGGGDGALICQAVDTSSATTRTYTANPVDYTTKKGWYLDLPATGERVVTDPALVFGVLAFTSNIPSGTQCVPGGSSWLNFLDYKTGGYVSNSGVISYSAKFLGQTLASRPVLIKLPSGAVKALIRKSDATTTTEAVPTPPGAAGARRVSWREVVGR